MLSNGKAFYKSFQKGNTVGDIAEAAELDDGDIIDAICHFLWKKDLQNNPCACYDV